MVLLVAFAFFLQSFAIFVQRVSTDGIDGETTTHTRKRERERRKKARERHTQEERERETHTRKTRGNTDGGICKTPLAENTVHVRGVVE